MIEEDTLTHGITPSALLRVALYLAAAAVVVGLAVAEALQ